MAVPFMTLVLRLSKIVEALLPITSDETIGSSPYSIIPLYAPSAASLMTLLTSSLVVSFSTLQTRSVTDASTTGTRRASPSIFLSSSGITRPMAFAAPVEVGMILVKAHLPRRGSLCGRSSVLWSLVTAWTVVMKPFLIVKCL